MAIRNIVKEGDPILNKVCRPVTTFDDRLATLLDDMHETMIAADGVGLAGPQVGMLRRLFVVWDTTDAPEEIPEDYEYKFIDFAVSLTAATERPGFVLTVTSTIPSSVETISFTSSLEAKKKENTSSKILALITVFVFGIIPGMILR